jgi:hypothetical protein
MGCRRCSNAKKKNKLYNPSIIHKIDLLSLINPSLAYVYCSIILSNYELIRLKKSSRKTVSIYAFSFIISLYLILCACVQTSNRTALKV